MIMWQGSPISWRSARQHMIAQSTAEAELQALAGGLQMCCAMEEVMREMGLEVELPTLFGDNQAALSLARNGGTWRSRHYAVKAAGLRQAIKCRWIDLQFVGTEHQAADMLTKLVNSTVARRARALCGMTPMPGMPAKSARAGAVRTVRWSSDCCAIA